MPDSEGRKVKLNAVTDYQIVVGADIPILEDSVKELLDQGWQPIGHATIGQWAERNQFGMDSPPVSVLIQTMVRRGGK